MKSPFESFWLIDANSVVMVCIKEPEKTKAAHIRRLISRRLRFGTLLVPRIERLLARGTVASPARLPGSELTEPLLMLVSIISAILSTAAQPLRAAPSCRLQRRLRLQIGAKRSWVASEINCPEVRCGMEEFNGNEVVAVVVTDVPSDAANGVLIRLKVGNNELLESDDLV
jgi:hypothetical protein